MEQHHRDIIRENLPKLVENVDAIQLLPYLPCLRDYHKDKVQNKLHCYGGSKYQAVQQLLSILETRPSGFQELVNALRNPSVDMHDIADLLDPHEDEISTGDIKERPSTEVLYQGYDAATQRATTTRSVKKKSQRRQVTVTMETPFKHLPCSITRILRVMDSGEFNNADKLAEVIGLTLQEREDVKAHCKESLTFSYLRRWDEQENITLFDLFQVLHEMERVDVIKELEATFHVEFKPDPEPVEDGVITEEPSARPIPDTSNNANSVNVQPGHVHLAGHQNQPYGGTRPYQPQVASNSAHSSNVPQQLFNQPQVANGLEGLSSVPQQRLYQPPIPSNLAGVSNAPQQRFNPPSPVPSNMAGHPALPQQGFYPPQIPGNMAGPFHNPQQVYAGMPQMPDSFNRQREYLPVQQPALVKPDTEMPAVGPCNDKPQQDGHDSLQSDRTEMSKSAELKSGGFRYSPEEILKKCHNDLQRFGVEDDNSTRDDKPARWKGYEPGEIVNNPPVDNKVVSTGPSVLNKSITDNQLTESKPLEHINKNVEILATEQPNILSEPRPEIENAKGDGIIEGNGGLNDLASTSSSNSDNSMYGSLPDNQDVVSGKDKKIDNIEHESASVKVGKNMETVSTEETGSAEGSNLNAMPLMSNSLRPASGSDSGWLGNNWSGTLRQLEHNVVQGNFSQILASTDSASREISVAASSLSDFNYASVIESLPQPLSMKPEYDSIMRKANKPGFAMPNYNDSVEISSSDHMTWNSNISDHHEERLSMDGASPGVVEIRMEMFKDEGSSVNQSGQLTDTTGTQNSDNLPNVSVIHQPPSLPSLQDLKIPNPNLHGRVQVAASGNERSPVSCTPYDHQQVPINDQYLSDELPQLSGLRTFSQTYQPEETVDQGGAVTYIGTVLSATCELNSEPKQSSNSDEQLSNVVDGQSLSSSGQLSNPDDQQSSNPVDNENERTDTNRAASLRLSISSLFKTAYDSLL